jgi:hypothetical protein
VRRKDVGQCIYCGAAGPGLSREHVIPYGLWGDLVLGQASCAKCATVTSAIENRVQRDSMLGFRTVLGAPTRDKKARPTAFPARVRRQGEWQEVELSVPEYTGTAVFPIFGLPSAWTGRDTDDLELKGLRVILASAGTVSSTTWTPQGQAGAEAVEIPVQYDFTRDPAVFARFVAKIAHGYAVDFLGIDGFRPSAVPAILADLGDIGAWVGTPSATMFEGPPNRGHRVRVGDDRNGGVIATIQLFADSGAPEYFVLVGRLP